MQGTAQEGARIDKRFVHFEVRARLYSFLVSPHRRKHVKISTLVGDIASIYKCKVR